MQRFLNFKVGGDVAYWVLKNMNEFGRVALCGAIGSYSEDTKATKGFI